MTNQQCVGESALVTNLLFVETSIDRLLKSFLETKQDVQTAADFLLFSRGFSSSDWKFSNRPTRDFKKQMNDS